MKRRLAPISVLLVWVVMGCATPSARREIGPSERARLLLDFANGALLEGDPTGALQTLMEAQELEPGLAEIHHSKAIAYHLKKDPLSAIEEARIAVRLNPKYSDANNTLGKFLLDEGRYQEAAPFLTKAAKDPLYREAYKPYTNLGILHYRLAQYPSSKDAFERAIVSSRENACIAYYYRGHLALRERRFTDAIHDYRQASRGFCGGFADARLALGLAYESSGKVDEARKIFLEVQEHFPSTEASAKALNHLRSLR